MQRNGSSLIYDNGRPGRLAMCLSRSLCECACVLLCVYMRVCVCLSLCVFICCSGLQDNNWDQSEIPKGTQTLWVSGLGHLEGPAIV